MGRYSPTVLPRGGDEWSAMFEALRGGVETGIDRYRTGKQDNRIAEAHDLEMRSGRQDMRLRNRANQRADQSQEWAGEQHEWAGETHDRAGDRHAVDMYEEGYRPGAPPTGARQPESIMPVEEDMDPTDPFAMGPAGVREPDVAGLPGQFDVNTGTFDPRARYIPVGRGYIDTQATPDARARTQQEESRRLLELALIEDGVDPARAEIISRQPDLADNELYPPEHGYYTQSLEEEMRLRGFERGEDGDYNYFGGGRGSERAPMPHDDAVDYLYDLYGKTDEATDELMLPPWIREDPVTFDKMVSEIINGTFDPAAYAGAGERVDAPPPAEPTGRGLWDAIGSWAPGGDPAHRPGGHVQGPAHDIAEQIVIPPELDSLFDGVVDPRTGQPLTPSQRMAVIDTLRTNADSTATRGN